MRSLLINQPNPHRRLEFGGFRSNNLWSFRPNLGAILVMKYPLETKQKKPTREEIAKELSTAKD